MFTTEFWLVCAESYWDDNEPLPADIYYILAERGIDVPAAEEAYLNKLNTKSKE